MGAYSMERVMGAQELNLIKGKSKSLSWKTDQGLSSKLSVLQKIPSVKLNMNFLNPSLERSATIDCSRDFKFQSMKRKRKINNNNTDKKCNEKELNIENYPEKDHLENSLLQRVNKV